MIEHLLFLTGAMRVIPNPLGMSSIVGAKSLDTI